MPTQKKRINVTLPDHVAVFLQNIALRDDVPQATKAADLIAMAMVIEEDFQDTKIADEIIRRSKGETITHDAFWSKIL